MTRPDYIGHAASTCREAGELCCRVLLHSLSHASIQIFHCRHIGRNKHRSSAPRTPCCDEYLLLAHHATRTDLSVHVKQGKRRVHQQAGVGDEEQVVLQDRRALRQQLCCRPPTPQHCHARQRHSGRSPGQASQVKACCVSITVLLSRMSAQQGINGTMSATEADLPSCPMPDPLGQPCITSVASGALGEQQGHHGVHQHRQQAVPQQAAAVVDAGRRPVWAAVLARTWPMQAPPYGG